MNEAAERLTRMAELAIRVGVDVQPGQLVVVLGQVENAPLTREIARAAYRAGASFVGSRYTDQHLTRALIELGPEASLSASTPWDVTMLKTLTAERVRTSRSAATPSRTCWLIWTGIASAEHVLTTSWSSGAEW